MARTFLLLFVSLAQDPAPPETDLDRALREAEARKAAAGHAHDTPPEAPPIRLLDLSLDVLFAATGSNQRNDELALLQGGGHDPRRRGFTVQNVELSAAAAVDPYLTAEVHLIYFLDPVEGESVFELEEAFATTTSLPAGLQVEAGQFFTEFGRLNPQHPHQWAFLDQPVIHSRVFGPDGLRGPGVRVGWLAPLPFFAELHAGVQNANGGTMASFLSSEEFFEERAPGGRRFVDRDVRSPADLLSLIRANASFDVTDDVTLLAGLSGLSGPNATGSDGRTTMWGADLTLKWRPAGTFRGWPFAAWQTEFVRRAYRADAQDFDPDAIPGSGDEFSLGRDTLDDRGLYSQLLVGFTYGWVAGLRYEFARSSGETIDPLTGADATDSDPFRDDRTRISLSLGWHPTEYSRLRLQYNRDAAEHLEGTDDEIGHSVTLGLEFLLGAHPAHKY